MEPEKPEPLPDDRIDAMLLDALRGRQDEIIRLQQARPSNGNGIGALGKSAPWIALAVALGSGLIGYGLFQGRQAEVNNRLDRAELELHSVSDSLRGTSEQAQLTRVRQDGVLVHLAQIDRDIEQARNDAIKMREDIQNAARERHAEIQTSLAPLLGEIAEIRAQIFRMLHHDKGSL